VIRLVGAVSPYILFAVAAVPFLAGSGLERLLRRQLGGRVVSAALIVVLLAGGLFATQLPSHRFERATAPRSDALAAAAAIIGRGARTGDAAVFLPRKIPGDGAVGRDRASAVGRCPAQGARIRTPRLQARLPPVACQRPSGGRPHRQHRGRLLDAASR
jgi:hypothetical protein